MNNELKIFENQEFGQVRIVERDDELLFCARDVLEALGYSQTMIANMKHCLKHVPDQWKTQHPMLTPGGRKNLVFLKEQGLYFFLSRSDKTKALPYQMWLAGEVVPSIRKNGGYIAGQEQMTDKELMARALLVAQNTIAEREKRIADMQARLEEQNAAISVMKPKAEYHDKVLAADGTIVTTAIAKEFGMTAAKLNRLLHQYHVQYKIGGIWVLYAEHQDKKYTKTETVTIETPYSSRSVNRTRWTQEGRKFIHAIMKEHGILPLNER